MHPWMQKFDLAKPLSLLATCPQLPGGCLSRMSNATEEFFHLRGEMKTKQKVPLALFTSSLFYLPKV